MIWIVNHGKNEISNSRMQWMCFWKTESLKYQRMLKRDPKLTKPSINHQSISLAMKVSSLSCFPSKLSCIALGDYRNLDGKEKK